MPKVKGARYAQEDKRRTSDPGMRKEGKAPNNSPKRREEAHPIIIVRRGLPRPIHCVPNRDFSSDILIVKHILSIEASNGCPFLLCIRVGLEKGLVDLKRERKR
jgi:hypothetical protein